MKENAYDGSKNSEVEMSALQMKIEQVIRLGSMISFFRQHLKKLPIFSVDDLAINLTSIYKTLHRHVQRLEKFPKSGKQFMHALSEINSKY